MAISSAELVDLLEDYGALLRLAEDEAASVATLETTRSGIETVYDTNAQRDLIAGLNSLYDSRIRSSEAAVSRVATRVRELLKHPIYVLEQASLGDSPTDMQVLEKFYDLFIEHSKTIQSNAVTLGTVTMDCANADCGKLVLDKKLDGATDPTEGGYASSRLLGLDSEIAFTDDFVALCETAEPRSSATFKIRGTKSPSSKQSRFGATGYGDGPDIVPIDYANLLTNGRFETFSSDVPSNWTLATGVAGTHTDEETGAGNIWLGSKSLKLIGAAALASIKLEQTIASSRVTAGKRYGIAAWVKGNTSQTQGDLKIRLTWDGASLGAGEFIDVPQATLDAASAFALYTAFVTIPLNKPTGLKVEIVYDGTPSAHAIYVSDVALGPATYFNGVCGILKDGKGRFSVGDSAAFTITNDEAGKFQTFNRDFFRFQWPSSGSPNVADSLIS